MTKTPRPVSDKSTPATRAEREAEALRLNLRRRKEQARARAGLIHNAADGDPPKNGEPTKGSVGDS